MTVHPPAPPCSKHSQCDSALCLHRPHAPHCAPLPLGPSPKLCASPQAETAFIVKCREFEALREFVGSNAVVASAEMIAEEDDAVRASTRGCADVAGCGARRGLVGAAGVANIADGNNTNSRITVAMLAAAATCCAPGCCDNAVDLLDVDAAAGLPAGVRLAVAIEAHAKGGDSAMPAGTKRGAHPVCSTSAHGPPTCKVAKPAPAQQWDAATAARAAAEAAAGARSFSDDESMPNCEVVSRIDEEATSELG